jgi:hypothetical protein
MSPETSRITVVEDQRRRNTAASARFRRTKKQRYQALEEAVKDDVEKVRLLEDQIRRLEEENQQLKDFLLEKNEVEQDAERPLGWLRSEQSAGRKSVSKE